MNTDICHAGRLLTTLLAVLLLNVPATAQSNPTGDTDITVRHLMNHVSQSGLTFVRNSRSYTSAEAAEHMHNKYLHFKSDIKTAEDFIELCATRSMLSGKPYLVIDRNGNEIRTSEWLKAELAAFRKRSQ